MFFNYENSKTIIGCLALFVIFGDKITIAKNEITSVPKLYEEIGCKKSDNIRDYG